jgi:hypothetical protein
MAESILTSSTVPLVASFGKYKAGTQVVVLKMFNRPYKNFKHYYLISIQGLEFFVTPDYIDKEVAKSIEASNLLNKLKDTPEEVSKPLMYFTYLFQMKKSDRLYETDFVTCEVIENGTKIKNHNGAIQPLKIFLKPIMTYIFHKTLDSKKFKNFVACTSVKAAEEFAEEFKDSELNNHWTNLANQWKNT